MERYARSLRPGQRAELHVLDTATGASQLLLTSTDVLFEAPNWHPDGRWIVVNGDGVLHRVDVDAPSGLEEIPASGLPELNNDHLLSPDGRWHYVSANDWHVYRLPFDGGAAERVTTRRRRSDASGTSCTACHRTAPPWPTSGRRPSTGTSGDAGRCGCSTSTAATSA